MSVGQSIVGVGFWAAFVIDVFIMVYAFRLSKKMGGKGLLTKVIIYTGLATLMFGLHHVLEVFFKEIQHGIIFLEGIEVIAALLLFAAVYHLYKLARGD